MKILIIDDEDLIRQLLSVFMVNTFDDCEIIESCCGDSAVEVLDKNNDIDLVISDYVMPNGDGSVVLKFVRDHRQNLPFVLVSSNSLAQMKNMDGFGKGNRSTKEFFLRKPISKNDIITLVTGIVQNKESKQSDYKKIPIFHFWKFNKVLCNVYIKLGENNFVKIINKNSDYVKADIDKYCQKSLKYLYIQTEDYNAFTVSLASTPFLRYKSLKSEKFNEESIRTTHAMIHELVKSVGVSDSAIESASSIVEGITNYIKGDKELTNFLLNARKQSGYVYDHSYLVSCICCEMTKYLDWGTGDAKDKLCYAAIFHDLELTNSELIAHGDLDPASLVNFCEQDQELFKLHPKMMAERIKKLNSIPPNVDAIVEGHHENVEGTGFPHGLSAQRVSPLIATFIIAHDFVKLLYSSEFDIVEVEDKFPSFIEKYQTGNYRKSVEALVKGLKINK